REVPDRGACDRNARRRTDLRQTAKSEVIQGQLAPSRKGREPSGAAPSRVAVSQNPWGQTGCELSHATQNCHPASGYGRVSLLSGPAYDTPVPPAVRHHSNTTHNSTASSYAARAPRGAPLRGVAHRARVSRDP